MRVQEGLCFTCLIFSLSVVIFSLLYCLLELRSGECDVVSLYVICLFCVARLTVYDILLLNVMDLFSVDRGVLLDRPCMVFERMCVLCL